MHRRGIWVDWEDVLPNTYTLTAYGTVDAFDQSRIASAEVAKAASGYPLVRLDLRDHPDAMLEAPEDTGAAHYRAAYWLAVAARLAEARGEPSGALVKAATWELGKGNLKASPISPYRLFDLVGVGPGTAASGARTILEAAASKVAYANVPEVVKPLKMIADPRGITRAHTAAKKERWDRRLMEGLGLTPTQQTLVKVGAVLVVGSVVLFALSPYFAAASTAVQTAERATRGLRRRR